MGFNFGDGQQAVHYFVLCFISILGVLQLSAARFNRRDLLWLGGQPSALLGGLAIAAGFVWFFWVDEEIFVPGLAGSEIIAIFLGAFFVALPVARGIAFLTRWIAVSISATRAK